MSKLKGDGSVYKLKSRDLWACQLILGYDIKKGKQIRKVLYAKTKSELLEKKRELEKESNIIKSEKFSDLFYKYLYQVKIPALKTRSVEKYEGLYKNYIQYAPFFYENIKDIKQSDVKIWYNNEELPRGTIQTIHALIKGTFKMAYEDELLNKNVLSSLKAPKTKVTKNKKGNYKILTKQEQEIFVDYLLKADTKDEPLKYLILFTLFTGLRLGEVLSLNKTDIKDNKVTINKSVEMVPKEGKYIQELGTPKTETSYRDVPIPKKIIKLLEEMEENNSDLLFPDEKTGKYIFQHRPNRRVQSICKKLNINIITFHSLRHTYTTRLFESNVNLKTVQTLLGHKDLITTSNIYTHVMGDVLEKSVNVLDDLL